MNVRFRLPILVTAVALMALACAPDEVNKPAFTGDISAGNPPAEAAEATSISGDAPDETPLTAEQESQLQAALEVNTEGC